MPHAGIDRHKNQSQIETVVKPPGLSSPCTMKGGEGLLTTFGVGFTPAVLKFSVVSTPLKFLRLVVYWIAR